MGQDCYSEEEINNFKLIKENGKKIIESKTNMLEKTHLKTQSNKEIMNTETTDKKRYNEEFIELTDKLSNIMLKQGEPFRARAYQKAQESIMTYPHDIYSANQLKDLPNIGTTIMDKLNEYEKTGSLRVIEREKTNPINILGDIYGVGPKKAKELVENGINTIDDLRKRQDELLNDIQRVGLKYYEQIQERIPRSEIKEYETVFKTAFEKVFVPDSAFEIVGSYRRGAETSGDIDVIITGQTGDIYKMFVNELLKTGIIVEILSRGQSKTLVIAKLPGNRTARRIDFLYAPIDEFAFAILYFTGSKMFNTSMRQYALNKGYTFNEHGIYHLNNKVKGSKVEKLFRTEKDIFDFLDIQFKTPLERKDGRSVITNEQKPVSPEVFEIVPVVKKRRTLKNKVLKPVEEVVKPVEEVVKPVEEEVLKPVDENITAALNIINDFKQNGISVLEGLNENQLNSIIHAANSQYYNNEPVMTDNQYDIIKEYIEKTYPNNAVIKEIGAEVERNKVKLPYEMASMDKIKPDTQALISWMNKFAGPYLLSCKLDGVSGLYTTEDAVPKLYTRGNGKVGQDISHLIPFLRLPKTKGIVIRGEFIIPKSVFTEKYNVKYANPRNMVAGIINHKTINDAIVDMHFVAYEVIVPQKSPIEQMELLKSINVECVLHQSTKTLTNEMLSNILVEWRKSYMYEIDGVIVTDNQIYPRKSGNPEHSFAFKMVLSDQIAEAKVVDVIWTPSKDGYLKPRVQIEPIHLGGVKIEYATGFNGSFIKENNIGIGATIEIIRSGDVIPHIKSVTVPAPEPKMPSVPFKWNDTHVDIMLENASEDATVKEKNITGFFRGIGVEGLSSGNISRLINAGITNVADIIKMKEEDFLKVDGFKGKMANKIYTGIQEKINEASVITLMAASNIFGRGFSDKKMEMIMNEKPDILISGKTENEKITEIASIKGMSTKTAEAFVQNIEDFKVFLKLCGLEYKMHETIDKPNVDASHPLYGKTVVLTGTRDKTVIEFLKNVGANLGSSISKNTFLVVTKSTDDDTGKAEEARKLNIPLLSVQEFIQKYI